jgi:lactaldehyde dehydrogenase/glycolaldehyde dehydrogenase
LREKFAAVRIGDRAQDASLMGPLVSDRARQDLHAKVLRAVAEGAVVETGGVLPKGPGWFYPATLLSGCRQDMEIVQEEIFGPVLAVLQYDTLDDALAMANDHQYGLSSVIYTENYRAALKSSQAIKSGEVYINRMPADPYQGFHSGWRRSGLGGDDGKHGMLEFTQTRLVVMNY